jgi:hypothetical protein
VYNFLDFSLCTEYEIHEIEAMQIVIYTIFSSGAGLGGSQPCQESPAHHEPSPKHEEAQAAHQETLAVLQEPAAASTGSSRKNSLMPGSHHRSLRESFRKLVRPLVKLRGGGGGDTEDEANNSTDDEAAAAASSWRDFSRRSSRRDSRQSAAGAQQQQHTPERSGGGGGGLKSINSRLRLDDSLDGNLAEEELSPGGGGSGDDCESVGGGVPAPDSKWRKILGISLAISR